MSLQSGTDTPSKRSSRAYARKVRSRAPEGAKFDRSDARTRHARPTETKPFSRIKKSIDSGGLLINLVTTSDSPLDRQGFIQLLLDLWGDRVEGILHTINDDVGERVEAREGQSEVIYGNEVIHEKLHGLTFGISQIFKFLPRE